MAKGRTTLAEAVARLSDDRLGELKREVLAKRNQLKHHLLALEALMKLVRKDERLREGRS